jgi:hypothetical protein
VDPPSERLARKMADYATLIRSTLEGRVGVVIEE